MGPKLVLGYRISFSLMLAVLLIGCAGAPEIRGTDPQSLLSAGDFHFLKEDYSQARENYGNLKRLYPDHPEVPRVQYQIAMSYFNEMKPCDRDQTFTKLALASFEYIVNNYPAYENQARNKIGFCKKRLADQEFYIGIFYYDQGRYKAAYQRFGGLLDKYPDDPDRQKTLYYFFKSWRKLQ